MIQKVIGLLFFVLIITASLEAEDYLILKGDTATSIAQKKKLPTEVLQRANPDIDWGRLKAGATITVPERYTVKPGDTWYSLARSWAVDQATLLSYNALAPTAVLKAGQVLFVPTKSKAKVAIGPFWPVEKPPHAEGDKLKSVTFPTSGEPFLSVSSGTVVYQGEFRGVGRVLLVESADKVVFAYGNFESSTVEYGQTIAKGQVLGNSSPRPAQKLSFFAFKQTEPQDLFSLKR